MPTWAVIALIAWLPVAAVVAVVVGRSIRLADADQAHADRAHAVREIRAELVDHERQQVSW